MKHKKQKRKKQSAQAPLEVRGSGRGHRKNRPLTGQEVQDEIFRKMSVAKKIRLTSELTMFCLKLNKLNETNNS